MSVDTFDAYNNSFSTNGNTYEHDLGDLYSRTTHRVRKALFPEISIENDEADVNDHISIVGCFSDPSRILKETILELLSVKGHSDASTNTISGILDSLNGDNPELYSKAVRDVYLLSKEDKFLAQFANNDAIICALVDRLRGPPNASTSDVLAGLLHISSSGSPACYRIFKTGGIAQLIRMLSSPVIITVHYAATTLHNLLLHAEPAKEEVISCGGIEALVPHLNAAEPKLQAMVADSLYLLLLDRQQSKNTFLALGAPKYLVNILRKSNYSKLLYAVIRCIRSISTCSKNKIALTSLGALELLHQLLLNTQDPKRRLSILTALRNLSDSATELNTLSPLVFDLVQIISSENDEEIVSCAAGILSNLTCNNTVNKHAVCEGNGLILLAKALSRYITIEDITEPLLCTLRHCTVRHSLAQQAQNSINFAYPTILILLATRRPPIVKAALGLIRNCALSHKNRETIIRMSYNNETVISISLEVFESSISDLIVDFKSLIDGVSLLEIVEGTISVFHQLSRDPSVARTLYSNCSLMKSICNLLGYEEIYNSADILILREILGLIYQISTHREGVVKIMNFSLNERLAITLDSPHRSIAAYSRIIFRNLNNTINGVNGTEYASSFDNTHNMGWQNDGMELELYNELYNSSQNIIDISSNSRNGRPQSAWFDTDL